MANLDVVERLKSLERNNGRLLPADVVEDARDPNSPTHSHFTWDDGEAAAKYRLDEARSLIRMVTLEVTVHDVPLSVVSYVRDPDLDTRTSGYRNVSNLRKEEDSARAVIIDEMKRVTNAVRRAKSLAAVLGFSDDIEEIDRLAGRIIERASAPEMEGV